MNQIKSSSLLIAFIAILLMASVPVIVKLISANEVTIALSRLAIAALGIYGWLRFKKQRFHLTKSEWLGLVLLGAVFALHWFTYFKSIKLSTPSIASIAVSTFGIHLILLSRWLLKQPIYWFDWIAMALALVGIWLIMPNVSWQSDYFIGLLCGIFSGLLYAFLPIIHQKNKHISGPIRTWGQFTFALLFFLFFIQEANFALSDMDWLGLASLGIVSTLIAHSLWVKATTELPGAITSMIYYGYVPVAMILSALFFKEDISLSMMLGAFIIITANICVLGIRWHKEKQGSKLSTVAKSMS